MAEPESFEQKWKRLGAAVGAQYDADVILYSGDIEYGVTDQLIHLARRQKRRRNVVLTLATRGGSPDAAYRIARCLQRQYDKFILYIYGMCKSAGTLISIGADEIILSDFGEFGPLDIQLGKRDELAETVSGLNITQALSSLNTRASESFHAMLRDLRGGSRGQISTKLAAEIATNFAVGLHEKLYAQIDPVQLGSMERSINIASDYGKRLQKQGENVKQGTVDRLVSGYSSHSFVIDLDEAKELFNVVRKPTETEEELAQCIAWVTRDPAAQAFVQLLNEDVTNEAQSASADESGRSGAAEGGGADNAAPSAAAESGTAQVRSIK